MSDVCVVGSFMMDLVAHAPRRPYSGETLIGTAFNTFLGGKGFNQAVAASRVGASTSFIGRLGRDDFGDQFLARLGAENINHENVVLDSDLGTGVGLPLVEPSGENSIVIVPRANTQLTVDDIEQARSSIQNAAVLLLQLEVPIQCVEYAAKIAADAGVKVVLNPAPFSAISESLWSYIDVIIPNEIELASLAPLSKGSAAELAANLAAQRHTNVVVTLGAKGCIAVTPTGSIEHFPAHTVDAIDTVGAGDVFCGVLGAEMSRNLDLAAAIRKANAAAAIAVTRSGGADSSPSRGEVGRFIADASIPHPVANSDTSKSKGAFTGNE